MVFMFLLPFHVLALIAAVKPRAAYADGACRLILRPRLPHAVARKDIATLSRLNCFRYIFGLPKIGRHHTIKLLLMSPRNVFGKPAIIYAEHNPVTRWVVMPVNAGLPATRENLGSNFKEEMADAG